MEGENKLTIFEVKALLYFLKDYINSKNLSAYEGSIPRFLLLALVKLQKYSDEWDEKMGYTE